MSVIGEFVLAATLRMCLAAARLTISRDVMLLFERMVIIEFFGWELEWLLVLPLEKLKECSDKLEFSFV